MILVLSFAWFALLVFNASLAAFLAPFVRPFHSFCLSQVPATAEFKDWIASVTCAAPLPTSAARGDLQTFGLVHLFIVSGLQLLLLEKIWVWATQYRARNSSLERQPGVKLGLLMAGYAALAGLPAPLLRALIQWAIRRLSARAKLFWRPAQVTLLAGLTTLVYAPELGSSLSLQIGWLASLVFTLPLPSSKRARQIQPARWQPTRTTLMRQILFYAALFVPLLPLGVPHPISILVNWLVAPLLSLAIFPLSVMAWLIHPLAFAADAVWRVVFDLMGLLSDELPVVDWKQPLPAAFGWIYLGSVQLFCLFREREPCEQ